MNPCYRYRVTASEERLDSVKGDTYFDQTWEAVAGAGQPWLMNAEKLSVRFAPLLTSQLPFPVGALLELEVRQVDDPLRFSKGTGA